MKERIRVLIGLLLITLGFIVIWPFIQKKPPQTAMEPHPKGQAEIPSQSVDELNEITYAERFNRTFPNIYLTLISIIQGVAVYTLSVETYQYIMQKDIGSWILFLPFSITSFLLIIILTFEYTWFVALFHWPPTIPDVIIPLGIGFFEILPMYYFTWLLGWCFLIALTCFSGAIAYGYSLFNYIKVEINSQYKEKAREALNRYYFMNIGFCLLTALIFVLISADIYFGWNLFGISTGNCISTGSCSLEVPAWGIFLALELIILIKSGFLLRRLGIIFKQKKKKRLL